MAYVMPLRAVSLSSSTSGRAESDPVFSRQARGIRAYSAGPWLPGHARAAIRAYIDWLGAS
jgi:hypothetical protein